MKLRLRNNSIRLRLTRSEAASLARSGSVEEVIDLAHDRRFTYSVVGAKADAELHAEMGDAGITVFVPTRQVAAWERSDLIGINGEQNVGNGKVLKILIEKDFTCLKPRSGGEDEDTFPNPAPEQ